MKGMGKLALLTTVTVSLGILGGELLLTRPSWAQSGSRFQKQGQAKGRSQKKGQQNNQPFTARFWMWLKRSNYKNWAPWPGQNADFYEGQDPHGAFLKMYVNRKVAGNPQSPPHGSIIVKENYDPQKSLKSITVMYRTEGYDPDNNDWYWVKYSPQGQVAQTPPEKGNKPIKGQFKSCIMCHGGADGNDLVFAND